MRRLKIRQKGEVRRTFLKTVLAGAAIGAGLLGKTVKSEAAPGLPEVSREIAAEDRFQFKETGKNLEPKGDGVL